MYRHHALLETLLPSSALVSSSTAEYARTSPLTDDDIFANISVIDFISNTAAVIAGFSICGWGCPPPPYPPRIICFERRLSELMSGEWRSESRFCLQAKKNRLALRS